MATETISARIDADASGLTRGVAQAEAALVGLERKASAVQLSTAVDKANASLAGLATGAARASAATATVAASSARTAAALNTVRGAMTSMAGAALSAAPGVAPLASVLGTMAIGTPMMIGVLAGAAALALAWDKITASAKAAKKEQEDALSRLRAGVQTARLGVAGEVPGQVAQAQALVNADRERLEKANESLRFVEARGLKASAEHWRQRVGAIQRAIDENLALVNWGKGEIARLQREEGDRLLSIQEEAAAKRKAAADRARAAELEATKKHLDRLADMARRLPTLPTALGTINIPQAATRDITFGGRVIGQAPRFAGPVGATGGTAAANTADPARVAQGLALLGAAARDAATAFSPMSLAARVVGDLMQGLAPALEFVDRPLRLLGELAGTIVAPALQLLMVPVRGLGIGVSYVTEALGWMVRGIGKLIDKLPGISGGPIIRAGQDMMDGAQEARDALHHLGNAAKSAADSVTNMPEIFDWALRRRQAGMGAIPGTTTGGVRTAEPRGDVHLHFHNPPAGFNGEAAKQEIRRVLRYDSETRTLVQQAAQGRAA